MYLVMSLKLRAPGLYLVTSDSVPSREVSPSDVASVLRKTRLGRIFKRTAPYPKKGVMHMSPVVSDRPGRGERTKR